MIFQGLQRESSQKLHSPKPAYKMTKAAVKTHCYGVFVCFPGNTQPQQAEEEEIPHQKVFYLVIISQKSSTKSIKCNWVLSKNCAQCTNIIY